MAQCCSNGFCRIDDGGVVVVGARPADIEYVEFGQVHTENESVEGVLHDDEHVFAHFELLIGIQSPLGPIWRIKVQISCVIR